VDRRARKKQEEIVMLHRPSAHVLYGERRFGLGVDARRAARQSTRRAVHDIAEKEGAAIVTATASPTGGSIIERAAEGKEYIRRRY
jgi:hypothetical protein